MACDDVDLFALRQAGESALSLVATNNTTITSTAAQADISYYINTLTRLHPVTTPAKGNEYRLSYANSMDSEVTVMKRSASGSEKPQLRPKGIWRGSLRDRRSQS